MEAQRQGKEKGKEWKVRSDQQEEKKKKKKKKRKEKEYVEDTQYGEADTNLSGRTDKIGQ